MYKYTYFVRIFAGDRYQLTINNPFMRKIMILSAAALSLAACNGGAPQLKNSSVDKVLKAMTLEEKVRLVIGTGMAGESGESAVVGTTGDIVPGAAGTTAPIERLGIPGIVLADGPAGLRIDPTREGDANTYYCTHFPIGTLLAQTFDPDVLDGIYNITCIVPMIGFALNGLILLTIYPLSKKKVEENAEILRRRHEGTGNQ